MAGPLRNVRHERFVQALFEGQTVVDAFMAAGYVRDTGNAVGLSKSPKVVERLRELQTEIAKETKVTVESICRELDEANAVAKERGQASAMVSASALRAKLAGLTKSRSAPQALSTNASPSPMSWMRFCAMAATNSIRTPTPTARA
jgi:DNA-binding phage protein